jgi:hypothetical protein
MTCGTKWTIVTAILGLILRGRARTEAPRLREFALAHQPRERNAEDHTKHVMLDELLPYVAAPRDDPDRHKLRSLNCEN